MLAENLLHVVILSTLKTALEGGVYMSNRFITIVSGLPRSGTSMMMKMLESGSMQLVKDNIRKADIDNPNGYYELEKVKELENDNSWLGCAQGKAIKIVSPILQHLDNEYRYKIIFMVRNLEEILASQRKMANRLAIFEDKIEDNLLKQKYSLHLEEIKKWGEQCDNIDILYVDHAIAINDPSSVVDSVCKFLDHELNRNEMVSVVDSSLHRHQAETITGPDISSLSQEEIDNKEIMERLRSLSYL